MKSKKLIFAILIIFLFSLGLFIQGQDYDVEIQATWGSSGYEFAYSLAVTSNNLFLAGYTNSFANVGAFLAKFTLSPFNVVWSKGINITSSAFYDVVIDSTNIYGVGVANNRPVIIKLDQASGNLQWARYLGYAVPGPQSGKAFSITALGSYFCLSGFIAAGPNSGGIFTCFDSAGNAITAIIFSITGFTVTFYPYGISSYSSNLYLAGTTSSTSMRGFIAKYDGTSFFVRTTSVSSLQNITSIAVDNLGNLYITGKYSNSIFLAKFDSNLNVIYTKIIQVTGNEIGYSIALDTSNNIYIGGRKNAQPDQAILVKLDNSGNIIWCKSWGGAGEEGIFKIRVDSNNEVHAAGFSGDINRPLNDITYSVNISPISVSFNPVTIDTSIPILRPLTPTITDISGTVNSPNYNEALYLKISPIVTTTLTTTTTTIITVTTTPTITSTTTLTTTTTTTTTTTATSTITTTTTLTTTTITTIPSTTVTVTACSPILLRVNEIEKINNVLSLNQILYFSLFTSISITFLFSYMIISNRRKIKWKKQQ